MGIRNLEKPDLGDEKSMFYHISHALGITLFLYFWPGVFIIPILYAIIRKLVGAKKLSMDFDLGMVIFLSIIIISFISIFNYYLISSVKKSYILWAKRLDNYMSSIKKDLEQGYAVKKKTLEANIEKIKRDLEQEYVVKKKTLESNIEKIKRDLEQDYSIKERTCREKIRECNIKLDRARLLIASKSPFKECAEMREEVIETIFQESEQWLINKRRPAPKARYEVKRMGEQLKTFCAEWKEIQYKYEYIINVFPGIKEYVEDDEDLLTIKDYIRDKEDGEDSEYDRRLDYLSKEEYQKLSDSDKSQLALDRYVASKRKSRWQIGRDYEMSCSAQLENEGYSVIMNGIKEGRGDLGRDLIAKKYLGGLFGWEILLVQCKMWKPERIIRENVIMQLFGTYYEYQLQPQNTINAITPVLMIPPTSIISDTAMAFAKRLGVSIIRKNYLDFPRIKCNLNHGQKIYHLPFDQLYDRTEIKLNGECYAQTVKEAETKGFRRAHKHIFQ